MDRGGRLRQPRRELPPKLIFDDGAEDRTEKAMAWVALLRGDGPGRGVKATETTEEKPTSTSASTCLLCDKSLCATEISDQAFPEEAQRRHFRAPVSLPTPQCCRDGVDAPPTVSSPEEWYDHVSGCTTARTNVLVVVAMGKAAAARLNDTKAPPGPEATARRKRQEEITPPPYGAAGTRDFRFWTSPMGRNRCGRRRAVWLP